MKTGFYPRLAIDSMRKNKRHYIPYFMSCILMVAIFYIILFLSQSQMVANMPGGTSTQQILSIGGFVIALFAVIFLFYTNSFLIRMRKKEFGLYNVLGMSKRNLCRVLIWETLISYLTCISIGLVIGIALSKFSELVLLNLVEYEVDYSLYVLPVGIVGTFMVFTVIFLLILCNSIRQILFSKPIDLVRSEHAGEKPPRSNFLLGLAGILILGAAYYIAVTIQHPLAALFWFLIAVTMVIVATYLIFISGSVLLCRLMQKNKAFYYKKKNFVSVSSMAFRMKRNGAGLASICILLTMVLVMISSSGSLYFGMDDCINSQYAGDMNVLFTHDELSPQEQQVADDLKAEMEQALADEEVEVSNVRTYFEADMFGLYRLSGGQLSIDLDAEQDVAKYDSLTSVHMMDLNTYQQLSGTSESLAKGEVLTYSVRLKQKAEEILLNGEAFHVVGQADGDSLKHAGVIGESISSDLVLIVSDLQDEMRYFVDHFTEIGNPRGILIRWNYIFDTSENLDRQAELNQILTARLRDYLNQDSRISNELYLNMKCESKAAAKSDYTATFGGLLFIGILMSFVFLVAAVLIIYYKQISEGFEDQARFDIMKKIGMTSRDIRETINSQMVLVFLMPILFAAMHTLFAFPVVGKLLMLFGFVNTKLFLIIDLICIVIGAIFYLCVYRITSNTYYGIVAKAAE